MRIRRPSKQRGHAQRLSLNQVESIIRGGLVGGIEPFSKWLNRANQVPMDAVPAKLAAYLCGIGLESLRWEHPGPWMRDDRVSITYLIATLTPSHAPIGRDLDWLSSAYEWKYNYKPNMADRAWVAEVWLEYHSAPSEYEPVVLQVLEEAMVGEIPYPILLSVWGASTDVGVQAKVLTARGILNLRAEPDPEPEPNKWSCCLVVTLPPGDLARNPNLPPIREAEFVSGMLRHPNFSVMGIDVWTRFVIPLPISPKTREQIQGGVNRGKWWNSRA